jgi:hypothetical protein
MIIFTLKQTTPNRTLTHAQIQTKPLLRTTNNTRM